MKYYIGLGLGLGLAFLIGCDPLPPPRDASMAEINYAEHSNIYICDYIKITDSNGVPIKNLQTIENVKKALTNEKIFLLYNNYSEALIEIKNAPLFINESSEKKYTLDAVFRYTTSTFTPLNIIYSDAQESEQKIGENEIKFGAYNLIVSGKLYLCEKGKWEIVSIDPREDSLFIPNNNEHINYIKFERIVIQEK